MTMDFQTRQHQLRNGIVPTSIVDFRRRTRPAPSLPTLPGWSTVVEDVVSVTATWLVVDGKGSVAVDSGSVTVSATGYVVYRVTRGTTTGAYVFRATAPEANNIEYLEWPVCRVTVTDGIARIVPLHVGIYFFSSVLG